MELVVPRQSRVYRVFMWSMRLLDDFNLRDGSTDNMQPEAVKCEQRGTNLCHMVRVIFLWMPAVFVWQLICAVAVMGATVALPLWLFGMGSWLRGVAVAVLMGLGVALVVFMSRMKQQYGPAAVARAGEQMPLLVQWVIAKKQKICPFVGWQ